MISKALYGLKASAARWADTIAEISRAIGFLPLYADTVIWMRDKGDHYEYITVYVDDLIIAAKKPMTIIKELEKIGNYKFKGVGVPEYYLGGNIKREKIKNSPFYFTVLSAKTYIKNIVNKIERLFDIKLKSYHSPLKEGSHPGVDASAHLDIDKISPIGRINVMFAAVTMSRYKHAPREGHFKTMFCIFGYFKYHIKASLKMDTLYPEEPVEGSIRADWKHLYPGAHKKLDNQAVILNCSASHMVSVARG